VHLIQHHPLETFCLPGKHEVFLEARLEGVSNGSYVHWMASLIIADPIRNVPTQSDFSRFSGLDDQTVGWQIQECI
jgi:hypothetical protein